MTVIPPWTIKGVPEEDREKVRAAAKRMDLPIGRWLVQASDFAIAHERDPKEAPGEVMEAPTEAPARVGPLEDLERLTGILERLQGVPKSEGVVAVGRRVLRQRLEALLVPTLAPRLRVGHGSGSTGDESM